MLELTALLFLCYDFFVNVSFCFLESKLDLIMASNPKKQKFNTNLDWYLTLLPCAKNGPSNPCIAPEDIGIKLFNHENPIAKAGQVKEFSCPVFVAQ